VHFTSAQKYYGYDVAATGDGRARANGAFMPVSWSFSMSDQGRAGAGALVISRPVFHRRHAFLLDGSVQRSPDERPASIELITNADFEQAIMATIVTALLPLGAELSGVISNLDIIVEYVRPIYITNAAISGC
jgi:hypothetical protein